MTPYRYCAQAMPAVGEWVTVWYSAEEVEACWTGAMWLDRKGLRLADVMCWRVK
jgi:hypothetical protein